jgi:hypothetical protein
MSFSVFFMKPTLLNFLCGGGLAAIGLACLFAGVNLEWIQGNKGETGGGRIEGLGPPPPPKEAPAESVPVEEEKEEGSRNAPATPE